MGQLPNMGVAMTILLVLVMATFTRVANGEECSVEEAEDQPDIVRIVAEKEEADLRVVVPHISTESINQFVNCSDPGRVRGYCIALFEAALISIVQNESMVAISGGGESLRGKRPILIHYTCFNFTAAVNASASPTYNDMVEAVANGVYDVVVGDVTIGASRMSKIDFTQKYMESGIVIVRKQRKQQALNSWTLFICPFTIQVWMFAVGAFIVTSVLLLAIEYKRHLDFQQDSIFKRIDKIFWFILEVMILFKRDSVKSSIGHLIMVTWAFIALLFGAIYTAGLTSFLTTSNLSPTKIDINTLKLSGSLIGYRRGSIVGDFLKTRFQIPQAQLLPIRQTSNFLHNLTYGRPIVDELPYVNVILSALSSSQCDFEISKSFTSEGFGFGFNKETNLANTFSVAILNLIERGCTQYLEKKWNMSQKLSCPTTQLGFAPITFFSSLILFMPLFLTFILCVSISIIKRFCEHRVIFRMNSRIESVYDPISTHGENDMVQMIRQRNQSNTYHDPDVYG